MHVSVSAPPCGATIGRIALADPVSGGPRPSASHRERVSGLSAAAAGPTTFSYHLLGLPERMDRPRIVIFRQLLIAEAARTEALMLSIGMPRPVAA
ncbi:MAG TPA: hypothetical protein VH855_26140 [Acetobacteraceae bacterium]|jgi:hypothetical protein